jgi:putative ABC transport system permease protein
MLDALSAIPGVEAAATSGVCLPLRGCGFRSRAAIVDGSQDPDTGPVVAYTGATPGLFDTLKIPVLRGAVFGDEDTRGSLAVINESLASLLWPDHDPIGQQFRLAAEPERGSITVAGVARDFLTWDSSRDRPVPTAFMHVASFDTFPLFFFLRTSSVGRTITTESIRRAIESLDVSVRRIVVTPMARVARDPFWRQQIFSWWFAVFGVAALTLTAVGIYGVLSFLVGQRAQEIGIRMALGANRRNVLRMVLRQGAVLAAAGTLIGLIIAFLLARTAQSLLFGIQPLDSGLFAIVTLFLLMISLIAMVVPALRATHIDPNSLLRT